MSCKDLIILASLSICLLQTTCHAFHVSSSLGGIGYGHDAGPILAGSSRRPFRHSPTALFSKDKPKPEPGQDDTKKTSFVMTPKTAEILDEEEGQILDEVEDDFKSAHVDDYGRAYDPAASGPDRTEMELFWCGREECRTEALREKVVGDHNEILFDHPATGQVAYTYNKQGSVNGEKANGEKKDVYVPKVLFLIRRNDDKLLKYAADAVREITSNGDITVMLPPEEAAKFKYIYDVDNDKIELFDPKPMPGFGGNHLPYDNLQFNPEIETCKWDECPDAHDRPDLVVTLGGDGLLMHASNLFVGPCPPILCVAGGSLGFLTPFSRCEMVDAIRISLGLGQETVNEHERAWLEDPTPKLPPPGQSVDFATDLSNSKKELPKVKFGANSQICLSMRMRLECQVINREGVVRARFNVLNEVVIDRGSSPYLAALECFCDDVHLTTVQADGVIFSTPTGSTAYSMAAGGSVVHPAVPAILVTPICPHVLSFRSMVFPDHVILRCYVPADARADASVAFDGKHRRELHRGDSVQIQMSPYPVPTINRADHSSDWLTSLKRNFNFNTRARQAPL